MDSASEARPSADAKCSLPEGERGERSSRYNRFPAMMPRTHRLSDTREMRRVFRFGKKAYGSLFSFVFLPNSIGESRFSIVVGKKSAPRAVDRNRIKRLSKESIRRNLSSISPGFDGIFVYLKKTPNLPSLEAVSSDIMETLRRSRLLSPISADTTPLSNPKESPK